MEVMNEKKKTDIKLIIFYVTAALYILVNIVYTILKVGSRLLINVIYFSVDFHSAYMMIMTILYRIASNILVPVLCVTLMFITVKCVKDNFPKVLYICVGACYLIISILIFMSGFLIGYIAWDDNLFIQILNLFMCFVLLAAPLFKEYKCFAYFALAAMEIIGVSSSFASFVSSIYRTIIYSGSDVLVSAPQHSSCIINILRFALYVILGIITINLMPKRKDDMQAE